MERSIEDIIEEARRIADQIEKTGLQEPYKGILFRFLLEKVMHTYYHQEPQVKKVDEEKIVLGDTTADLSKIKDLSKFTYMSASNLTLTAKIAALSVLFIVKHHYAEQNPLAINQITTFLKEKFGLGKFTPNAIGMALKDSLNKEVSRVRVKNGFGYVITDQGEDLVKGKLGVTTKEGEQNG